MDRLQLHDNRRAVPRLLIPGGIVGGGGVGQRRPETMAQESRLWWYIQAELVIWRVRVRARVWVYPYMCPHACVKDARREGSSEDCEALMDSSRRAGSARGGRGWGEEPRGRRARRHQLRARLLR